jgi:hypothetical protein
MVHARLSLFNDLIRADVPGWSLAPLVALKSANCSAMPGLLLVLPSVGQYT